MREAGPSPPEPALLDEHATPKALPENERTNARRCQDVKPHDIIFY